MTGFVRPFVFVTNSHDLPGSLIPFIKQNRGGPTMKSRKLNYRIHDPNPPEVLANYLIGLFVEVNTPKIEAAMIAAESQTNRNDNNDESHPAKAG